MLRKRVSVLVAVAVIVLAMFAASALAFAQECSGASCELKPGNTEMSRRPVNPPSLAQPGYIQRDPGSYENDPRGPCTGRGERILGADSESCQPFPG